MILLLCVSQESQDNQLFQNSFLPNLMNWTTISTPFLTAKNKQLKIKLFETTVSLELESFYSRHVFLDSWLYEIYSKELACH